MRASEPLHRWFPLFERLVGVLVRPEDREALLGDLREAVSRWPHDGLRICLRELAAAAAGLPLRLFRTLSRQNHYEEHSMRSLGSATERPIAFASALGILGGAALIITTSLTRRGPMIFIPYSAIVMAALLYLRVERVRPFARRFALSLGSFMLSTVLLYVFIGLFAARTAKISPLGHAWRLGMMLLMGSVISGAVAQLSSTTGGEALPS